ncbi:lipopolysaccharide biosynthesis protein [Desulfogranum mediterraneum]|uniref:lipopolysaccharide biosynthesis protein n=1 Tax=Desulfogranum mediterraneum TaxID=160661 RepID=UPI0004084585|nr:lipopolysaccharide biosynthesis protein [Desulfogranum mediterraneum]
MSLKQKTVSALSWSACERFSQQGIQFIITIILARLLRPQEFGLIGMLTIFIALAQSFINSGFGQALIQKQDATYLDECSIFYFNIVVGFLAAGALCLAAPWISAFYDQPLLIPLTQALSLNLVLNAFGLIQTTLLNKHIDFKTLFKVGLGATLVSGVIGITMAYKGFGVWSLVVQSLSRTFMNTILLWVLTSWRPAWRLSLASLKQMFGFGSRLLFAGILDTIFVNIYLVVIGKLFSPTALGYYTQAKNLQHLPVANICSIVGRVTFPVFSSLQNDKARLKRSLRKALTTLVLVVFPLMVGLGVLAKPLILVLLGEQWLPSVPYVRLLCVIGAFWPLHVINLNVLNSLGRSDLFFRLEIFKKILVVLSIFITYRWGIEAMLWGQIVTSFVAYYLNSYYTGKLLGYTISDQIRDLLPYFWSAFLMGLFVFGSVFIVPSILLSLIVGVILGVVSYYWTCKVFKMPAFEEMDKILKNKIQTCF